MSGKDNGVEVMIRNGRLSFPALFEAQSGQDADGKPTKAAYQAHVIVEPESEGHLAARKAIQQVANNEWGENGPTVLKQLVEQGRVALRSGDSKTTADGAPMDGYAGNFFVSARSYVRPTVVNTDRSPLTADDGKPYSGCYVNAKVRFWPQKGQYGKRVNCQLMGVQFVRDGEAFGGGRVASPDEFDSIDEFAGGESESAGSDDNMGGLT